MAFVYLTTEQQIELVRRLLKLADTKFASAKSIKYHKEGVEYTSLMVCFFLHICSVVDSLLKLFNINPQFFPVPIAFILARSIFETNITALYISKEPRQRALAFIEYGNIVKEERFRRLLKYKDTNVEPWAAFVNLVLSEEYYPKQDKIEAGLKKVKPMFEFVTKAGKKKMFTNWANKSMREMAIEVNHEIEYDIFYPELSNFTHNNIHLADLFLTTRDDSPFWTTRADEGNIGYVFGHVATFFSCFLTLMSRQFNLGIEKDIDECWNLDENL